MRSAPSRPRPSACRLLARARATPLDSLRKQVVGMEPVLRVCSLLRVVALPVVPDRAKALRIRRDDVLQHELEVATLGLVEGPRLKSN